MERLLIVFNVRDFQMLSGKSKKTGIIGISQNLSATQIDKKLASLLLKSEPSDLYRKFTYISGKTR